MALSRGRPGHTWRVLAVLNIHHTLGWVLWEPVCSDHGAKDNQGSRGGIQLPNAAKPFRLQRGKDRSKKRQQIRKSTALAPMSTHLPAAIITAGFDLHEASQCPEYILQNLALASSRESVEGEIMEKHLGHC